MTSGDNGKLLKLKIMDAYLLFDEVDVYSLLYVEKVMYHV